MNLTKPQKLIYEMEKFHGGAISVVAGSMLFEGTPDLSKVKKAVNELFRANDALRTKITEYNGETQQTVLDFAEQKIEVLNFDNETEFKAFAEAKAKEPLDLTGSLCDIKIIVLPEKYGVFARLHHIISDAWTLSLMGTQFNKLMQGEEITAYSYSDYAESETAYSESKRFSKDKEFFIEQFKKCDEATFLNEKQTNTLNAERKTFVIKKDKAEIIRNFAGSNNTSEFLLFLNALSSYINRTKLNTEKFYIGTAVLNRSNFKEKNTMGMFINTVPLLIELENEKSFKENLESIEKTVFSVFRHQKFNYGDVLKALRQEFDFQEKLYDVMLSYQNATVEGESFETEWYHCGSQSESLQIHIDDRDNEGIFKIHYDYLTEKFTENEIERLNSHILNLLFDGIENENKKLYELNVLSEEEKNKLLFEFNDTKADYPKDKCVHELFEEKVKEHPDKTAVVACDRTLTYKELNEEANRIAHSLIEKGVKNGDIVAVILPRNSHLIPAMFGILKTGAAYMPLDTSYPKERIDYLINESGATHTISESNIGSLLSSENTSNPNIKTALSDLFSALHTSGSTGNPKVTALRQQNLLNFLHSNTDFWDGVDTVISVTISTFDVFMQDSVLSAAMGKKIILASNEQIFNQTEFEKMFENENNVMFFATPTKLTAYIKQSETADFLTKIRSLIVGGEVFTDELYNLLVQKIQPKALLNGYGPCETTITNTYTDRLPLEYYLKEKYKTYTDRLKQPYGLQQQQTAPQSISKKKKSLMPTDLPKRQSGSQNEVKIINIYGPAETTIWASTSHLKIINVYGPAEAYIVSTQKFPLDLHILPEEEKNKLLFEFNDTKADSPKNKCIHELFEEQAKLTPTKKAVIFKDTVLTYAELEKLVQSYANKLIFNGIKPDDVVGVHLERSHKLIAFQLAVLKIGAVFLPVDKRYPSDRIEYMCGDCNVKLLISDELSKSSFTANIMTINEFEALVPTKTAKTVFNDDVCYIIYTSGSTGTPKGCTLHSTGLLNFCKNNNTLETLSRIENCTFACVNSVSFDYFIAESLLPLTNGFTTVILDDNESTIQEQFLNVVIKNNINVVMTTPTRLKIYFDDRENCEALRSLKCICTSGEPLTSELLEQMYKKAPEAQIYNPLGPSECTVWNCGGKLNMQNPDIHIGKPIANTQIYIVDKFMNITPIGVTGELCIAGDCVGAGYLNRPELTAEKFVDNPFGEGKLYKTGDLAYWREDGNIAFVGRNDFQVKIRGLRIELGEIENALSGIEGISQAVVVVRKNNEGRQLICAFYTGEELEAKEIRSHIGKKLPKYMLPHIFTHLSEMPLTPSGKISRKTLPEIDLYDIQSDVEYIAPVTEQEKAVAEAIKETLNIEKVGILDNFIDLGGDSLKSIELISLLEKQSYYTDTKTILECDTVKELAEKLEVTENEAEALDFSGDIPATPAQMRVYTAQNMNSDSTTYNVPYVFKVNKVDKEKLQKAINALIDRHEILRTHFENKDGNIIQVINNNIECELEELENGDITAFIRPFKLSEAPLLRVGVFENTVMVDMHHIITDGSSMPIFFNELNELYMGRELKNEPVQYKEFAVKKADFTDDEKYWLSVFNDEIPVLEINTSYPRKQKQSFIGNAIYDHIDIELHNKISAYCKAENITPFVFYMAAFNIFLSKFSGNEDIVVGIPVSGRSTKHLNTLGMFVNTVALRNKPTGTKKVSEFLKEVKNNSINAFNHQGYPYGELVKKLKLEASNRNPLFDVMFAYQSEEMTDVVFGDEKAELLPVPITTAKYDFTFNVMPRENDVVIMAEYCTDLYTKRTIQRFINGFKLILEQILSDNNELSDKSSICNSEQHTLLFDFNDTVTSYPENTCIYQAFEEQAKLTPTKKAVIFKDTALTYAELEKLVQSYANKLIFNGIKPDDVVGVHLERSHKLIAFQLAVLKIGAVFLPVDKRYPSDRIEYMCGDCNVKLLISDELSKSSFTANIMTINEFEAIVPTKTAKTVFNDDVCYIIYTSGSTGTPKGCTLHSTGLLNFCKNNNTLETLSLIENCTFACVNSVSFDYFIAESLLPLTNGFTTVILDDNESTIQEQFLNVVIKNNINVVMTTPTRLKIYFDDRENCEALRSLKCICTSGEPLTSELLEQMYKKAPEAQVYNPIGPSECSVWDIGGRLEREDGIDIHIGKPIANTQIYIVDKYMHITPIGVTGELCIAGDCVGAGYLNRPELTAEKFVDNPFGEGKLYKTGDLAYWREDGNIAFVGRNDFQVKIRGLRIELGEIENALSGIEGISQAVVVVRKNNEGRQLICAFYTGEELEAKEIRSHIGKNLPKYMLPHIFTHLSEMPLTSSGKVNRKTLPEIDLENIVNDAEFVAPQTTQQKELCKLVEAVLSTSPVGIEDDFFDLGGDSLKAIELVSKAHTEGIYFALQNVFDYPTVRELCKFIENGDKQAISFNDVDFTEINKVLEKNKIEYITEPQKCDVRNILLAGATGYLGIHILKDFLDNDTGTAYCLVRGNSKEASEKRLQELLEFYFGSKYKNSDRINVVCADLQKEKLGLQETEYNVLLNNIDTVINCAASVKHYGSYKYFYETNVESVKKLIDFCKASDAKLIHTSTLSVSGNSMGDQFDGFVSEKELHFYENTLYINQPLENVYARSKFEAEKAVLDAMSDGLRANIMRMGNLTNRLSDGKFQKNYESNAFLQRVKAVLELKVFPEYLMYLYAEFTPIDEAANAVMTIARHFNTEQNTFHINSIKVLYFDKLLKIFNDLGFDMKTVDGEAFTSTLRETAKHSGTEHIFETFINDMDENDQLNYDSNIRIENDFTVEYLKALGFEWADIDFEYMKRYVEYFKEIGYLS